ncbi:MAG: FlgD immunoglobulin-like domain containing protein [Candidatus Poribacteria bacterium]|nr:FlgD immunoglobulin-like domain containing protein [Candidatus Poribacteria bacterium]
MLKLNTDLSITFSSEEAKDLKEGIEQELSTLIDYEDISKLYWQFGSVNGLDLLVWDPTTKKWQKPDGKKPISIDKNKPFIKLIPDKTFATDFKEGKLKITVFDMWDTEDKGEIPIRIVQPPKFQDFPKVINIRCGQADYQSTFSTAYLDLYSYVTLDSSIKTDKARLEWSWEIWEAGTGKYRKPVDKDRFKVIFRPTAKQVQLTEKLVTITVASNFFGANNETTFVDQKVRFSAKDPTTEESGTVDVTLRIWKPNSKAEVPILQGLKDRDIYPGQELALNFTVFDLDSSAEELVWNNSIPEALSVIMEKETPVAGIQKGRLKIKVAESFEQARDTFQIDITIKDPDCNLLEQPLKISIIDPPDKTPPKIEVFAVAHPLLPRIIFITITANEKLKGAPTVTVGRQRLSGLKAEPEQLIWHQTHFLSSDGEGTITILAKGTDLSKNTGSGEATLKTAVDSPAAPTKPATTKLHLNFPNPFNPETWIPYQLAQDTNVSFRIYNAAGELVRQLDKGFQPGGFYLSQNQAFYWDGKTAKGETVASGTYFYQIQAGDYTETRKMTILK